jgi:hypothetical protein
MEEVRDDGVLLLQNGSRNSIQIFFCCKSKYADIESLNKTGDYRKKMFHRHQPIVNFSKEEIL